MDSVHNIPRFQLPVVAPHLLVDTGVVWAEGCRPDAEEYAGQQRENAVIRVSLPILNAIKEAVFQQALRHVGTGQSQSISEIGAEVDQFVNAQIRQLVNDIHDSLRGQSAEWQAVRARPSLEQQNLFLWLRKGVAYVAEHIVRALGVVATRDHELAAPLQALFLEARGGVDGREALRRGKQAAGQRVDGLYALATDALRSHLCCSECSLRPEVFDFGVPCSDVYPVAVQKFAITYGQMREAEMRLHLGSRATAAPLPADVAGAGVVAAGAGSAPRMAPVQAPPAPARAAPPAPARAAQPPTEESPPG